jgi:hypothetical protein
VIDRLVNLALLYIPLLGLVAALHVLVVAIGERIWPRREAS